MYTVYLIRHGETTLSRKGALSGATDVPLSRFGIRQMEAVAEWLKDKPLSFVYSSPLRRAAEPAAELAENRKLPHSEVMDLCEIDFGDWEGKTWEELSKADSDAVGRAQSGSALFTFPNGEGVDYFRRRVQTSFAQVLRISTGPIAIYLHGGPVRMIIAGVNGLSIPEAQKLEIAPGSITVLTPDKSGFRADPINQISHLPAYDFQ